MTRLARIRADVCKRLLILACAAALLAAACSKLPQGAVSFGKGAEFVPYVADNLDDAGLGNAIAVDKDGVPYVSYLIFPGKVAAGQIALPRPIGAPFIQTTATATTASKSGGAIGVASVDSNSVWTRGAAAQVQATPAGIYIPFGPFPVPSLVGATAKNTNGTDIAIDANGNKYVVWAGTDGIWEAGGSPTFSASQVYAIKPPVTQAGPVGRPSVAVDSAGKPWVAFTADTATGEQVMVATLNGTKWKTQTVATIPLCSGCPQPGRTEVGVLSGDIPIVVYVDGSAGAVMAARPVLNFGPNTGTTPWTTEIVQGGITPSGLSLAVDKNGVPFIAYYTGDGAVNLATASGSGWTTGKVADAQPGNGTGNQAETTGVAIDDNGKVSVAWYDATKNEVLLASGDGTTFAPVQTRSTQGGGFPSVGVAPDGSRLYLVWYDVASQDLFVGIESDVSGLLVAEPSPSPLHTPPPIETCAPTGSTKLTLTASGTAFDTNCLAVSAGKAFTVSLVNQDPFPHDFSIYPSSSAVSATSALFNGTTKLAAASATTPYDVTALKAGTYYFQCDLHPTAMFGTFIVK